MSQKPQHQSRILIFDIARIVLLTLVLHIHLEILADAPKNFLSPYEYLAVPLFVTLSFYLTAKHFLKERMSVLELSTRLKRLIVPLVFWSLVGFLPHLKSFTFPNIFLQFATGELVNLSLYYLNLLVVITLICFALTYVPRKVRIGVYALITLLAFYLQYSLINYHYFHPLDPVWQYSYSRLTELLPYAMVGLGFGILKSQFQKQWLFPVAVSMFGYLAYRFVLPMSTPLGFNYQGLTFFTQVLFIFPILLLLARIRTHKHAFSYLERLGGYTFGVYLFHYPAIEVLLLVHPAMRGFIDANTNLFLTVFLLVSFAVCFVLDSLTKKKYSFLLR